MQHSISLAVLDISGTTVKDKGEITEAFANTFKKEGHTIPVEKIAAVMGYKKTDAIKTLLEAFAEDKSVINENYINRLHQNFIDDLIDYYKNSGKLEAMPYAEDTFELLRKHDIKIGLDTGFFSNITHVIIEQLGWLKNGLVDYVISSDEAEAGRPYPYMIRELMKRAGVTDPKKVIKAGDTEVDIKEGRNAACLLTIAVTTGKSYTREQLQLYKPDYIIDSLKELPSLL
ncbi:HAD family hydrolase [Parafilimonas sp.]|uniref:HAD family hydrolase n=1 Tax=Parafilimonas sp. TaxID=1969739 RepID=UPI0039E46CF1